MLYIIFTAVVTFSLKGGSLIFYVYDLLHPTFPFFSVAFMMTKVLSKKEKWQGKHIYW